MGHHPWIVMQGQPGDEQLLLFYFTHDGKSTVMQVAEIEMGDDGTLVCDRNRHARSDGQERAQTPRRQSRPTPSASATRLM